MRILGISSQFHDAAVTVIEDGHIVFASQSERYSRVKNDPWLNHSLINAALEYGIPDLIALHENPWVKRLRYATSGNWNSILEPSTADWIKSFYPRLAGIKIKTYMHHETHAAAGVLTSPYDECAVLVIDAIGEFDCTSIWQWKDGKLSKKASERYPHSLGLFYSAVTQHVGLKPMEDEYILMGMAAYGDDHNSFLLQGLLENEIFQHKFRDAQPGNVLKTKYNLHKGLPKEPILSVTSEQETFDMARAAQQILQERVLEYMWHVKKKVKSENLVFMGGVALNCVLNSHIADSCYWDSMHIMPNPGDAGSSLGAAALAYYQATGKKPIWDTPYLGYNIKGKYPIKKALASLEKNEIFGIANGRSEFGPRALGNRSLLADARGGDIKNRLNETKLRQKFRPFAPIILEEHVHEYFYLPKILESSPYMQYIGQCLKPDEFPAIAHIDGTSRVQTVNAIQHPGMHKLLTEYYKKTGCPMLVNTSLNIKGQPIVNDEQDAKDFTKKYGIPVHLKDT